jgi:hypothetical protein
MMKINSIITGALCLIAGFAAGRFYPTAHYVHIGATMMYNERTGHMCHGLRGGETAAGKGDPKAPGGDAFDALLGPAPGHESAVPFCGEEEK